MLVALLCAELCVLSQLVANPHSRSVAPNQPTFAQRWQWGRFRATLGIVFFCENEPSSRYSLMMSRAHFAALLCGKCSEVVCILQVSNGNRALATVLCTFCRQLVQIEPRTRGNRDPILRRPRKPLYPKKTQGFALEIVFTRELTRTRIVALPNCLMMVGWHDDVVDMMMAMLMLTTTIVRNSEAF